MVEEALTSKSTYNRLEGQRHKTFRRQGESSDQCEVRAFFLWEHITKRLGRNHRHDICRCCERMCRPSVIPWYLRMNTVQYNSSR